MKQWRWKNQLSRPQLAPKDSTINNGEDILLADTPEDFANAVVRVFREPDFAQQLGERAAQTVRERFSWNKVADRVRLDM